MDGSRSHWTDDDDDLIGLVADALADVPPWVASAGRAAYTWRSIDVELAALQVPTEWADCDPRDLGDEEPTAPSATATTSRFAASLDRGPRPGCDTAE